MILERIVESHEKDKSQNLDEQLKRLVAEVDELKKENMLLKQKIARFESMGGSGVYGRVSDGNPLDRLSQEEKTLF
ncbi:MAG: hypothetical protein DRO36_02050 [Candidatus Hecatellales archaeon]|nr:MAG: hypothetical protein DRO36_02050 [Candidatus Hecatellales archaeon]